VASKREQIGPDAEALPPPPQGRAEDCKTKAERVEFIEQMMAALTWERGRSGRALAKVWNVEKSTVRDYAAEASRNVRAGLSQDEAAIDCAAVLELAMTRSIASAQYQAATAAVRAMMDLTGCAAPTRVAVEAAAKAAEPWTGLSEDPAERSEQIAAVRRQLDALEAECAKELGRGKP